MRNRILIVIFFSGCTVPAVNLTDLQYSFRKPEYLASNDGWAEARRRRLLGKYLTAQRIPYSETTVPLRGKYNRVSLHTGPRGAMARKVTLSLTPQAAQGGAQARCDQLLFALLEKKAAHLDFIMTDSCIVDR